MKKIILLFLLHVSISSFGQLEISSGYATNRNLADGAPLHMAYEFKLGNKLSTKSQIGYKNLRHENTFVGAILTVKIWEFHQTLAYEVVKRKKYILKPNVGVNYRFYKWIGVMRQPLDQLPMRGWSIGVRDGFFDLRSTRDGYYREYAPHNLGFSFQIQNQFRLNDKVWLHVTPFVEPDYDRSQNTGGCYVGFVFKQL